MRKGTHHTPETRLRIRMERLRKSMPAEAFAEFAAADGALKWCPACSKLLPVSEFHKNSRAWDGLYDRCKACNATAASASHAARRQDPEYREWRRQRTAEWREELRADGRLSALNKKYALKKYGLTPEAFAAMRAAQDDRCAICRLRLPDDERNVHVDHDHSCCSGKRTCGKCVRGLLCGKCNVALGGFRDDPRIIRRAAAYLERYREGGGVPTQDDQGTLWGGPPAA
jgi:hypothetical protein